MKLLLIGDERKNRRMFAWGFSSAPYSIRMASSRSDVGLLLDGDAFQAACIDLRMQDDSAWDIVDYVHRRLPSLPIIAMGGDRRMGPKERGVRAHLSVPFEIEELHAAVRTHALDAPVGCIRKARDASPSPKSPSAAPSQPAGWDDEAARRTIELALRAANSHAAILILGETGTGKSMLAQTIHAHSALRQKAFVTVNCPCLNHELLESDLFGHVRGAFTGAVHDTWGKVAAAEGGTLFLDEIGDLPMSLQPKLLRLLQEKQYERVGETTSRSANVRIIAATNRDLKKEVAAGRFREDLYYRLNVIAIELPPLGGRPAAIMGAAESFLADICRQLAKPVPTFSLAARRALESYSWPGNLRELRNVIERAAILSSGPALETSDFPVVITQVPATHCQVGSRISLQALENAHIQLVIASCASLEEAARVLEIDKSTLYRKRKLMAARLENFQAEPDLITAAG